MPAALLKPCPGDGGRCTELVESGRCKVHERQAQRYRGTSASRGYGWTWVQFRRRFMQMLIAAGIAPVCGAALPGGPSMKDSKCKADGVLNDGGRDKKGLNLHHDPPLQDWERSDRARVEDPMRVGLLCHQCHSAETMKEMQRA